MSYDVYWVKNRAEKIADFEHPTPRDTALTGCSAMVGCGATARRHSLLCLYWLLERHLWENNLKLLTVGRSQFITNN